MKLEEAASILGVSLDDITVDGLKQTYKKLALAWESEKSADQNLKGKYQQVSEAYQKIISAMEDREPFRGDDSHEVAAFMRMFMDMVGISESDSIPAAMTFGMMFGSNQSIVEEWSTDEDGEGEYDDDDEDDDDCDDDEDDEEYLPDEYFDEYAAVGPSGFPVHMSMPPHPSTFANAPDPRLAAAPQGKAADGSWEPQVKQYSNMNLKDQLNSQRAQIKHGELADDDTDPGDAGENGEELTEAEKERKLKLAKKRAEKRKKQKEKEKKKSREANGGGAGIGEGDGEESKSAGRYNLDFSDMSSEDLTGVIQKFADQIIAELTQSVTNGQLGKVNQILSYDFVEEMPALVATETVTRLKELLPTAPLLHHCVTNLARGAGAGAGAGSAAATAAGAGANANNANAGGNAEAYNAAMLTALAARRLEVAKYLLTFNRPPLELGTTNASGLSVLHYAVANGDLKVAQVVLRALTQTPAHEDRKPNLNVNSRCHRQGWAPLHYAVDRLDVEGVRLLAQHGANLQATVTTGGRQTPMELAKQKLKAASGAGKAAVQAVIDELQGAMDRNKASKEAEAKIKRQNSESHEAQEKKAEPATATVTAAQPAAKAVESSETTANSSATKVDKKKKKKEKAGGTTTATPPAQAAKPADTTASLPNPPPNAVKKASEPVPVPVSVPAPAPAPATVKNKKGKGAKAAAAQATQAAAEPSINPIAEMSVSSRDELVDRLLAMGFRESDCLQAIALYGTDIDRAISWLCEKPMGAVSGAEGDSTRAGEGAPAVQATATTPSTPAASTAASSAAAGLSSAQKLQKEKEELRRINQAWNQKAIEEKRKAEALKKQQELEKQQAELLAKQQADLQRQQQEFMYQQHLQQQQQYLALQQAHLQTYYAAQQAQQAQQAAMFGGAPGMGVGAGAVAGGVGGRGDSAATAYGTMGNATNNASYPLGSLGHMANMLASNAGSHSLSSAGAGISGNSFGSHLSGVPGLGGSASAPPTSAPSLQSLSGAMAMAMGTGSAAVSMGAQSSIPSLRDAMSMTYSSPHAAGMAGASPRLGLPGSSPPRGDALGGVPGSAGSLGGGAFGLGLGGAQSSLGLFGSSDPLAGLGGFSGSGLSSGLSSGLGGSNSNNSSSRDVFLPHAQDALVDGALELSAGAKPFIPRFGPSTGASGLTSSPASSTLSGGASLGAFGVGSSLGSNLGGLGLGAPGLGGNWNTTSGLSLDANKPDGSKMPDFLSSLLPSELNLDEDAFDASGIIPDLDSFLLNDN